MANRLSTEAPQTPTLTERQLEVLSLVGECLSDKEMAARLCVNVRTINFHLANLRTKFDVHSRQALWRAAMRAGLLPWPAEGEEGEVSANAC